MSMIRRNATLQSRLGESLSVKTGIPVRDIIVRHPSPSHSKPVILSAKSGSACDLCGKVYESGEPIKRVIVQDRNRPTQTLKSLIVCHRSDRCVKRYKNRGE